MQAAIDRVSDAAFIDMDNPVKPQRPAFQAAVRFPDARRAAQPLTAEEEKLCDMATD